ncbi:MAG: hypothetical protein NTU49_02960 [Gammaproteobacteria bacterium]|nr:hypothetical protein [Gammaproteobacteria bacterium]
MTTPSQIPTIEEAKAYIDSIDFSMIIDKIVSTKHWKKSDVSKICDFYKNFLFLKKKYFQDYEQLPPSEEVDEFWHNHILDTKKYKHDCDKIFGFYLDHYPYFGIDGKTNRQDLDNAFNEIQKLHYKEFGDYIYVVRTNYFKLPFSVANLLIKSLKQTK